METIGRVLGCVSKLQAARNQKQQTESCRLHNSKPETLPGSKLAPVKLEPAILIFNSIENPRH